MTETLMTWEPDPVGEALGTGFSQFHSPCGVEGLGREKDGVLDVLAVSSATPRRGFFREFVRRALAEYREVRVI